MELVFSKAGEERSALFTFLSEAVVNTLEDNMTAIFAVLALLSDDSDANYQKADDSLKGILDTAYENAETKPVTEEELNVIKDAILPVLHTVIPAVSNDFIYPSVPERSFAAKQNRPADIYSSETLSEEQGSQNGTYIVKNLGYENGYHNLERYSDFKEYKTGDTVLNGNANELNDEQLNELKSNYPNAFTADMTLEYVKGYLNAFTKDNYDLGYSAGEADHIADQDHYVSKSESLPLVHFATFAMNVGAIIEPHYLVNVLPQLQALDSYFDGHPYEVTEGDGQVHDYMGGESLTITTNGNCEKFSHLEMDGTLVPSSNYEVKAGSTIITLKADYLDTLDEGDHILKIVFADTSVTATIRADYTKYNEEQKKKEDDDKDKVKVSPDTRDYFDPMLWSLLGINGILLTAVNILIRKKYGLSR